MSGKKLRSASPLAGEFLRFCMRTVGDNAQTADRFTRELAVCNIVLGTISFLYGSLKLVGTRKPSAVLHYVKCFRTIFIMVTPC